MRVTRSSTRTSICPRVIRRNVLEPLAPHLPGEDGFKPLSKLRSYIEQASIPLPERLETWNLRLPREARRCSIRSSRAASIRARLSTS